MEKQGKLENIELSGFKSIKSMDLKLNDLNVLIGANGSGKSNFISFFRLMSSINRKNLAHYSAYYGGAERFLHFGSKVTEQIDIKLKLYCNFYQVTLRANQLDKFIFEKEICYFDKGYFDKERYDNKAHQYKTIQLSSADPFESGLPNPNKLTIDGHIARYIDSWIVYHFHDTGDTAKVKKTGEINDNYFLAFDAANLAAFLYSIRQTQEYRIIVDTIRRIAPFFEDFFLAPQKENDRYIKLQWRQKGMDNIFDAYSLSDGTLRFICLATLLLQPESTLPSTILLDEPELGLHPDAIKILGAMIKMVAQKTQVIIATQSPELINEFSWQDIIVVEQIENESKFKRLDEQEIKLWLEDYKMGDIWKSNVIGGNP